MDNGYGLPALSMTPPPLNPNHLTKLFQPFERNLTNNNKQTQ